MKKQIFIYNNRKKEYMDHIMMGDDIAFFDDQIKLTEKKVLQQFEQEIQALFASPSSPLELRFYIAGHRIKHCFLYEGYPFLVRI